MTVSLFDFFPPVWKVVFNGAKRAASKMPFLLFLTITRVKMSLSYNFFLVSSHCWRWITWRYFFYVNVLVLVEEEGVFLSKF